METTQRFLLNSGNASLSTPVTSIALSLTIVVEGKMLSSSLVLDHITPGDSSTSFAYTFSYSKDLSIDDEITLCLPYWDAESDVSFKILSPCGADFSISTNGLDTQMQYAITIKVTSGKYLAGNICSMQINSSSTL